MAVVAVAVAALAGFVASGVYYAVAPAPSAQEGHAPPKRSTPLTVLVELLRSAAVATMVAVLVSLASIEGAGEGALIGLLLVILPVTLLVGSVFHEGVTIRSAALHAGDWLLKLLVIGAVVGTLC